VLLEPARTVWVDVVVPAGDPCWRDDVADATHVVGEAWAGALRDLGFDAVAAGTGRTRPDPLTRLVCFAGLGPGEVTAEGRKIVGLSQRRTRAWARVQGALLTAGGTATLRSLLAPGLRAAGLDETRPWPPMGLVGPPPPVDALAERLAHHLS
jgi:lipoate-protein ligase A